MHASTPALNMRMSNLAALPIGSTQANSLAPSHVPLLVSRKPSLSIVRLAHANPHVTIDKEVKCSHVELHIRRRRTKTRRIMRQHWHEIRSECAATRCEAAVASLMLLAAGAHRGCGQLLRYKSNQRTNTAWKRFVTSVVCVRHTIPDGLAAEASCKLSRTHAYVS